MGALRTARSLLVPALAAVLATAHPAGGEEPDSPGPAAPAPSALAPGPAPAPVDDQRDVLEVVGLRRQRAGAQPKRGEPVYFVLPSFGVNPNVGVALGVGATGAMLLGSPENTIMSSLNASLMATTKEQVLATVRSVILTAHNEWELLGDLRFYEFSEPTYGLGTGPTPVSEGFSINGMQTEALPGEQPMKFKYVKAHETAFHQLSGPFYLGAGYHLDLHSSIRDERLDTAATPPAVTSHYAYSKVKGFDPTGYALSGFSLDALYESRDHTLEPHGGAYGVLSVRSSPEWLGSSQGSTLLHAEGRAYLPVSAVRPRHLVALWLMYDSVLSGAVPYLDLPAIGYDTRGRSGRGYPAGRFRGTALAYAEAEYRFPLTRNGVLGGVAFLNLTTAARPAIDDAALDVHDPGVPLFHSVKAAAGAGLRVAVDRRARMNACIDLAFSDGGGSAFYLAMGEAF